RGLSSVDDSATAYSGPHVVAASGASASSGLRRQILLDEPRTQTDVDLNERPRADATEAVDLAVLHDGDITRRVLGLLALDDPEAAARLDELHFVVWMPVRCRTAAGLSVEEERRDADVAILCANEMM